MIRRWGALAGVAVALGATAAPASAYDLSVTRIEVTQAVQTDTNSIELVANRSTAVRATVSAAGAQGTAGVQPVTGRLHVFQNGAEITPPAGVPAINEPFTVPATVNRANEAHTLNFELAAPTGIGASSDVDFRVDLTPQPNEENQTNNSGVAENLVSRERAYPRVFFVPINYLGRGLPDTSLIRPGTGDAFICGILPVDDSKSDFYRRAPLPSMTFDQDSDGDGVLEALETDGSKLLSEVAAQRQLLVDDGVGANDLTHLYGWVKGAIDGNGLGQLPGHVAYGNTEPERAQRTFAHELTHNFGLDHINRDIDPFVGWDVGAGLDQNPATNNTLGRVKPQSLFDVQVAGRLTNTAWVDQQNYEYLLEHDSFAPDSSLLRRLRDIARRKMFVVRGQIDPSGGRLRRLEPSFQYPWRSQASTPPRNRAGVEVRVTTTEGKTYTALAAATVGDDSDPGVHTTQGYFEAMLPVKGTVSSVRVVSRGKVTASGLRKAQLRTIGVRRRSIRRPALSGLRLPGGKTLDGRETMSWAASDRDTKSKNLTYQAAYSPDGGQSFVPIDVDFKSRKLSFDADELPASEGDRGLIRIFVSDGINSTYRDLRGITLRPDVLNLPSACKEP